MCVFGLVGTESTLGGPGMSKGGEAAVSKADTTAGSSTTQKIEKPQEVISFEAAKEVLFELLPLLLHNSVYEYKQILSC